MGRIWRTETSTIVDMEEGMTYSFNPDDYDLKEDLKVSLIIPLYNKRKVFRRCIDSIVNQTYKNLEILIWDDCSTDDSLASIADIADPRIVRCQHVSSQ